MAAAAQYCSAVQYRETAAGNPALEQIRRRGDTLPAIIIMQGGAGTTSTPQEIIAKLEEEPGAGYCAVLSIPSQAIDH